MNKDLELINDAIVTNELSMKMIEKFGIDNQLTKCVEEMSDLTNEIRKYKLYGEIRHLEAMKEECVDVSLMLVQVEIILMHLTRTPNLKEIVKQKQDRMRKLLDE